MELDDLIGNMKTITVSGAHKGVGKTVLTELLLRHLPGFAAIKITVDDLYASVSDDEKEIMIQGKDTFRMKKSGAEKVVWVKTTEKLLPEVLEKALVMIGTPKGLLIEGNSILEYINPALAFFVIDGTIEHMKPSRIIALKKADICVINQKNGYTVKEETLKKVTSLNSKIKIVSLNLAFVGNENSEELNVFKKYLEKVT